jgi:hypothetical protein
MKSPSLAIVAALLCRTVVSDPWSPAKPTSSLRGSITEQSPPVGEAGRGNSRELQYADMACYQKDYNTDEGTIVQEVACSQIMGNCRNIETVSTDDEADAQAGAENSNINSWYVWYDPNAASGSQWKYTVCS